MRGARGAAVLHSSRDRHGGRREVVCAHQLADVWLGEGWAVNVRWPLLRPGWSLGTRMPFGVGPWGGTGGGVREGLEGQWTLPGAEVCMGQGGVQGEQVGWWGQDLSPLGV